MRQCPGVMPQLLACNNKNSKVSTTLPEAILAVVAATDLMHRYCMLTAADYSELKDDMI